MLLRHTDGLGFGIQVRQADGRIVVDGVLNTHPISKLDLVEVGDVITVLNRKQIFTFAELETALNSTEPIILSITRPQ